MANIKIDIHNRGLDTRIKSLSNWKIPSIEQTTLKKFLGDLELGKVNKGNKIGEARRVKYLDILKVPLEYFNKDITKLTLKEMESFEKDLSSDKIKSRFKKKPYSNNTKSDIRRALRTYIKYRLGDTEKFRKLTDWLDLKVPKQTPDYLTELEIEKLYKSCKTNEQRFLIAVLFDTGCRAEEFHNIRKEDIQLPNNKDNYVKVTLKDEYSKTSGRVISLFWKNSLESVRDYLNERKEIKMNEAVFGNKYDNARQFLNKLGKKVLGRNIHYHLFRHSSATYYANKLNRQQLCYRYGWKFSSQMPDVYINRAGMENKELDEKFSNTELEDIKNQFENYKLQQKIKEDEYKKFLQDTKQLNELTRDYFEGKIPIKQLTERAKLLSKKN